VSLAAEFITGQGARLVIGQTTFTNQESGTSATVLGGVGGVAVANGRLFAVDANRLNQTPINNRVVIFDTTGFPKPTDEIQPYIARCPVCVGQANVVLGQDNFTSNTPNVGANRLNLPIGVATDGTRLAIADTLNNRVLIFNVIPTTNGQPADVAVGQTQLDKNKSPVVTDQRSLRAPQGVWLQNGRLFVADTQNHRVLIWNSIPTSNNQPADIVLGQNNFTDAIDFDPVKKDVTINASITLSPTSVSSDGIRLFVTDLGLNRVLIWNSIPTRNNQPADVVIGQPDFTESLSNNSSKLCIQADDNKDGVPDTDANGNPVYPFRCKKTLNFPRFALSDGRRLFVADGGNDRVLIYNTIPTQNGAPADIILGQSDEFQDTVSSTTDLFHPLLRQSAADITATPTSLAWDGLNLYVADPSNRRILVFTEGEPLIPINGVRNAASREIFALGSFSVRLSQTVNSTTGLVDTGKIVAGDTVTLKIAGSRSYTYTVTADEVKFVTDDATNGPTLALSSIMTGVANLVNANNGDPDIIAEYLPALGLVKLQARHGGTQGNDITIETSTSEDAGISGAVSGATLQGGENATVLAPGTIVSMLGTNLAALTAAGDMSGKNLPLDLAGVQVYFDGIRAPLYFVSPTQVNSQIPFEVFGSNNISMYMRIKRPDGSVIATAAVAVPIDEANPGIFAQEGSDPRVAVAYHASSFASGSITVDGAIEEGDTATITVQDRTYLYTVKADDTLDSVRDALVALLNTNSEEILTAVPVAAFHRLQLRAKIPGPAGEGIPYSATSGDGGNGSIALVVSSNSQATCCANVKDSLITLQNPAVPGETIYFYATGLGPVQPEGAQMVANTGERYSGPALNAPLDRNFIYTQAGGTTANTLSGALEPGTFDLYKVVVELGPGTQVGDNRYVGLTMSQHIYTSNTANIAIRDPNKSTVTTSAPPAATGDTSSPIQPAPPTAPAPAPQNPAGRTRRR
jgi:hypothetical protein